MKTTKRIIAASAKTSAVFQRIIADKKALRERWLTAATFCNLGGERQVQSSDYKDI